MTGTPIVPSRIEPQGQVPALVPQLPAGMAAQFRALADQDVPPLHLVVETWLTRQLSVNTSRSYRTVLRAFAEFLGCPDPRESAIEAACYWLSLPRGKAYALAGMFLDWSRGAAGKAIATVRLRMAALLSLSAHAEQLGAVAFRVHHLRKIPAAPPTRDTRGPGGKNIPRIRQVLLEGRDMKRKGSAAVAVKFTAIVALMSDCGLRVGEALGLDWPEHVDLEQSSIWILGKGKVDRQRITLPGPTAEDLVAWLRLRGDQPGPVFCGQRNGGGVVGKRISRERVWRKLQNVGAALGIRLRSHAFRHSAISELLTILNGDVRAAMRFSRHTSLSALLHYDDERRDDAGKFSAMLAEAHRAGGAS